MQSFKLQQRVAGIRHVNAHQHCRKSTIARTAQLDATDRASKNAFNYTVTPQQRAAFLRDGFVLIQGVATEAELDSTLAPAYNKFLHGEVKVDGKDINSEESALLNIMHPREYAKWDTSLLDKRCEDIARQLLETDEVELDFDQILAKRPRSRDSGMPWHQDEASWPEDLSEAVCSSGTANVWVAVSDVPVESGCMRYLPGSHLEQLRKHESVGGDTLRAQVGGERAVLVPMKRGDVLVHHERVVHGSGPNLTDNWRCGYILNFKRAECVVEERQLGFTNTLNDVVSWKRKADASK